jgi:AcrR family transcriptional regulator
LCNNFVMRKYELKRRAESQAETRRRIVEAAVELHGTKGPGLTTFSDVARLAGVQRNTLYRHFPDERSLLLACSGHYAHLNPPPDPATWRAEADATRRLRRGLTELYSFYERAEEMLTRVARDAEFHEATREIQAVRGGTLRAAAQEILAEGLPRAARTRSMLNVALDFRTWQRLVRGDGLTRKAAVETMVKAILAQ